MPRRSNCVPFEVTVKFRLMPLHEPGSPHSLGGLCRRSRHCVREQIDVTYVNWTTSALSNIGQPEHSTIARTLTLQRRTQRCVWRRRGIRPSPPCHISTRTTHSRIRTVHCCASCGRGGGCATWKSTSLAALAPSDSKQNAAERPSQTTLENMPISLTGADADHALQRWACGRTYI